MFKNLAHINIHLLRQKSWNLTYLKQCKQMNNTIFFSQIMRLQIGEKFRCLVKGPDRDKNCKGLNCWTHLVTMVFFRFRAKGPLKLICQDFLSATGNLVLLGISTTRSKSAPRYKNEYRNAELFEKFFYYIGALLRS